MFTEYEVYSRVATIVAAHFYEGWDLVCRRPVACKKSVRFEIIDILTQTCQPFIHDDPAKTAL
jgi:hypothetical protein